MGKLCGVMLFVLMLCPVAMEAQMGCVNFDNFCDALELELTDAGIVGTWVSWDCSISNAPLEGYIDDGLATVLCVSEDCPNGSQYAFNIDPSTFDLWDATSGYFQIQDDQPWTLSDGACPPKPQAGRPASTSR